MDFNFKIQNLRNALNNNLVKPDNYNDFFNGILDILKDINSEIDELNELIEFSKY
jgi:hypothetical protein